MTLSKVKGLGPKRLEALARLGITDAESLLWFFPTAYFFADPDARADAERDGVGLLATVTKDASSRWVRGGLNITSIPCADADGNPFTVVYYNRPYIASQYKSGARVWVFGSLTKKGARFSFLNPVLEQADEVAAGSVYTVYPTVAGVPRKVIKTAIAQILRDEPPVSVLTAGQIATHGLGELATAVRMLHEPQAGVELAPYARTCAVEETVQLFITYRLMKNNSDRARRFVYGADESAVWRSLEKTGFALTSDQARSIREIFSDLRSPVRMNRLLQGDVGSGKTVVAFAAMRFCAESELQCALLAPTEVLAAQHYKKYCDLYGEYRVCLLTGGMTAKEKSLAKLRIASGEALVVIGTHALFQPDVVYARLALVVTDEQHRFGVGQRSAMEDKGRPDVLIMSATPIPRTMALLLYGELEVSTLREKPIGRLPVVTRIVPESKVADMYGYVVREAQADRRTYLVVPRVEEDNDAVGVKSIYATLTKTALKGVPTGILYGSMPEKEKQAALDRFAKGETKVLVSTTVIEVGVDVRQACNMIILDAERFGLAQLHQLRGRVGRGSEQGYCFLLSRNVGESARARFDVFRKCNDGFALAEYDLVERGAGDFIGARQHGEQNVLSTLSFRKETIDVALECAEDLLTTQDPEALLSILKEKYASSVRNVTMN